ncbi:hypothetical protein [Lactiplantibacillus plantarum]|uniref:hypothetical protein n=1 Tax=Lactiplantibacillus plantarum TaxID=1590 RepID=UPI000C7FA212|nr:hypothetical protein [Lactiplantibacillus plantarum]PME02965.1 hypothetical protein S101520_00107 [Lactiplantibacillus plantarum subsp. plantarum]
MEQSEFNTTQAINETVKQGYSLHDIYSGLGNVMNGIEPKHLTKQELVIDLNVDTSKVACQLRHAMDD